ncbi:MAG: 4'-phosphopantetheinyl transferase family protein [Thermoguttaceae bacterium]
MSTLECRWPAPPEGLSLAAGDVHLWSASLDLTQAAVDRLEATLSADEQQRADRFRSGQLRNRFIAGRATLRAILARYLAASPAAIAFQYNARGKPSLAPPWDRRGLGFNLSHAKGLALVAVAGGREVGVDVEFLRPIRHLAGMVARWFSAEEQRQWQALPAADQPAGFFRAWTCKEAWLKALGAGLSLPLEQVSVAVAPDEPPRLLSTGGDPREAGQWRLKCLPPAAGYVAAVAVRGPPPRLSTWRWEPRPGTVPFAGQSPKTIGEH